MPHDQHVELDIEVFRTGDYGLRGRYTEADLDAIAAAYDPAIHEAPVTLDHRQEGPAFGWVSRLRRHGDRLVATLARLSPALLDAVRRGSFRKRSIELFRSFDATGGPYLKAVSFLGAAAPAVRGLADPSFAVGEGGVLRFEASLADPNISAEAARARLEQTGRWTPVLDQLGLAEVFAALEGTPHLDRLVAVFEHQLPAAVSFGRAALAPGDAHDPAPPGATIESVERHRRALRLQGDRPALSYAEALVESSRATR